MLKVNLIVVSGKPEGKVIPVALPIFRIGRDETCHLKPNSVEVSRAHTEIAVTDTDVTVRDLGSRNGTLVNGKLLSAPHRLKSGELLKVGPLTFAVSIQETAASIATLGGGPSEAAPAAPPKAASGAQAQIESWLVADNARPTPDRPSGVYDGDTLTIDAYTGATRPPSAPIPSAKPAAPAPKPEPAGPTPVFADENLQFERLEEGAGDPEDDAAEAADLNDDEDEPSSENEFLDESNPFYIPKKTKAQEAAASKPAYSDTSDAANDILRKMLERRRASRS